MYDNIEIGLSIRDLGVSEQVNSLFQSISKLNNVFDSSSKLLKNVSKGFEFGSKGVLLYENHIKSLLFQLHILKKIVLTTNSGLSVSTQDIQNAADKLKNVSEKLKSAAQALETPAKIFQNLDKAFKTYEFGRDVYLYLNKVEEGFSFLANTQIGSQVIDNFSKIRKAISATHSDIKEFISYSVTAFVEFEQASKRVGTILRSSNLLEDTTGIPVRASKKDIENNARLIKEVVNNRLSNTVSSIQALQGEYEVLSAGFTKSEDASKVLEAGLKLQGIASSGGVYADSGEILRLLSKTLRAYNYDANQAARTAAIINSIVENGITTIQELSQNLGQTAVVAKQAGVSLEDLSAAVSLLTSQGMSTATALTGLQALFDNIINKTPEVQKLLASLKDTEGKPIRFDIQEIKEKGLVKALIDLYKASGRNPTMMSKLFPYSLSFRTAMGLLSKEGEDLSNVSSAIKSTSKEELDRVFSEAKEDTLSRLTKTLNRIREVAIDLGKALLPIVEPIVSFLERISKILINLPEPVKQFIAWQLKLKVELFAISKIFTIIVSTLYQTAINFAAARTAYLLYSGSLAKELYIFKELIVQKKGYLSALAHLIGFNQAWRLNTSKTIEVLERQKTLFQILGQVVQDSWNKLLQFFSGAASKLPSFAQSVQSTTQKVTTAVQTTNQQLQTVPGQISQVGQNVTSTFQKLKQNISQMSVPDIQTVGANIKSQAQNLKTQAQNLYNGLHAYQMNFYKKSIISLSDYLKDYISTYSLFGIKLTYSSKGFLSNINNLLAQDIFSILNNIKDTIFKFAKSIYDIIYRLLTGQSLGIIKFLKTGSFEIFSLLKGFVALSSPLMVLLPVLAVGLIAIRDHFIGIGKAVKEANKGLKEFLSQREEQSKKVLLSAKILDLKDTLKDFNSIKNLSSELTVLKQKGLLTQTQFNFLNEKVVEFSKSSDNLSEKLVVLKNRLESVRSGAKKTEDNLEQGWFGSLMNWGKKLGGGLISGIDWGLNAIGATLSGKIFTEGLEGVKKVAQDREADIVLKNISLFEKELANISEDKLNITYLAKEIKQKKLLTGLDKKIQEGFIPTSEEWAKEEAVYANQKKYYDFIINNSEKVIQQQQEVLKNTKDPELQKQIAQSIELYTSEVNILREKLKTIESIREETIKYFKETLPELQYTIKLNSQEKQTYLDTLKTVKETYFKDFSDKENKFLKSVAQRKNEFNQLKEVVSSGVEKKFISHSQGAEYLEKALEKSVLKIKEQGKEIEGSIFNLSELKSLIEEISNMKVGGLQELSQKYNIYKSILDIQLEMKKIDPISHYEKTLEKNTVLRQKELQNLKEKYSLYKKYNLDTNILEEELKYKIEEYNAFIIKSEIERQKVIIEEKNKWINYEAQILNTRKNLYQENQIEYFNILKEEFEYFQEVKRNEEQLLNHQLEIYRKNNLNTRELEKQKETFLLNLKVETFKKEEQLINSRFNIIKDKLEYEKNLSDISLEYKINQEEKILQQKELYDKQFKLEKEHLQSLYLLYSKYRLSTYNLDKQYNLLIQRNILENYKFEKSLIEARKEDLSKNLGFLRQSSELDLVFEIHNTKKLVKQKELNDKQFLLEQESLNKLLNLYIKYNISTEDLLHQQNILRKKIIVENYNFEKNYIEALFEERTKQFEFEKTFIENNLVFENDPEQRLIINKELLDKQFKLEKENLSNLFYLHNKYNISLIELKRKSALLEQKILIENFNYEKSLLETRKTLQEEELEFYRTKEELILTFETSEAEKTKILNDYNMARLRIEEDHLTQMMELNKQYQVNNIKIEREYEILKQRIIIENYNNTNKLIEAKYEDINRRLSYEKELLENLYRQGKLDTYVYEDKMYLMGLEERKNKLNELLEKYNNYYKVTNRENILLRQQIELIKEQIKTEEHQFNINRLKRYYEQKNTYASIELSNYRQLIEYRNFLNETEQTQLNQLIELIKMKSNLLERTINSELNVLSKKSELENDIIRKAEINLSQLKLRNRIIQENQKIEILEIEQEKKRLIFEQQQKKLSAELNKKEKLQEIARIEQEISLKKLQGEPKHIIEQLINQKDILQEQLKLTNLQNQQEQKRIVHNQKILLLKEQEMNIRFKQSEFDQKFDEYLAKKEIEIAKINKLIEQWNTLLSIHQNRWNLQEQSLQQQNTILSINKDFIEENKKSFDIRLKGLNSELQMLSSLTKSDLERKEINRALAKLKIESTKEQLKYEQKILEINQEQQRMALETDKLKSKKAQVQSLLELQRANLEYLKLKQSGKYSKEEEIAALLSIQDKYLALKSAQFEEQILQKKGQLLDLSQRNEWMNFQMNKEQTLREARLEYANTLHPILRREERTNIINEIKNSLKDQFYLPFEAVHSIDKKIRTPTINLEDINIKPMELPMKNLEKFMENLNNKLKEYTEEPRIIQPSLKIENIIVKYDSKNNEPIITSQIKDEILEGFNKILEETKNSIKNKII